MKWDSTLKLLREYNRWLADHFDTHNGLNMTVRIRDTNGFRMVFDRLENGKLVKDSFPEERDGFIKTKKMMELLASLFAKITIGYVFNIRIVDRDGEEVSKLTFTTPVEPVLE